MAFTVTDTAFPFKRSFSLRKLVDFWKDAAEGESKILADQARTLLAELDQRPELLESDLSPETLKKHHDLVRYLMTPLIPIGGSKKTYAAAIPPFNFKPYYATECFDELDLEHGVPENLRISGIDLTPDEIRAGKAVNAYVEILKQLTGFGVGWVHQFVYTTDPDESGLRRHFKFEFDPRFVDLKILGEKPNVTAEDVERIQRDPLNLTAWTEILPPDLFEFEGFTVLHATEVTIPEELSYLKDDLLQPRSMSTSADIDNLEWRLRTILQRPKVELGLIAFERTESGTINGGRPIGRSLLMYDANLPECPNKDESFYAQAFESGEPVIVTDLESCKEACTGFEFRLMDSGYRNLVIAPLHYEEKLVGLLELASPVEGDLNNWNVHNLLQVRGLFATAINREIEAREDRIQSIMKKRYTAIHPAVEWRFREAALRYMEELSDDGRAEPESIVFDDVFPLFGLSDIRGSSMHRVDAIRDDLLTQLNLAMSVVRAAGDAKPLPVLDELAYQIEKHQREIQTGLTSGDELTVLEFLRSEIEPRLDHLASFGKGAESAAEAYRSSLDPSLDLLYQRRRDFDQSVHMINERIAERLEQEQERAQDMFPHYFERYLTDGVDYNIYIGASLVSDGSFDPIYLRNLRLWQLMMTCAIVWDMEELKADLPTELETAHLILAQSSPLSIRFRDDEKQFDVDGAYNARYEIIKKRIDKAKIKETGERLTQPGMIAVVYAQPREAEEYRRYMDYLHAAGFLTGEIENLVLEDLQGVSGLRALRVKVASSSPDVDYAVTPTGTVEPVSK